MRLRAEGVSVLLPPPNGAQMTRRMALTQSSMSVWELAISRKDSWLCGARSFSPVPPGGRGERREERGERRDQINTSPRTPDCFTRIIFTKRFPKLPKSFFSVLKTLRCQVHASEHMSATAEVE
ncbi:hypothetical protein EYF80_055912 [Liparis tanakae]|uniref:Uncharacterized protein n=1 Tax=Liparis tanakae TaxID=230148 RepID=A0A4Z2F094_9TELE|nr:hypothetical protein EYF80_055912 [Liparis tanakae]